MDVTLLTILASVIGVLIIVLTVFLQRFSNNRKKQPEIREAHQQVRRAAGVRNARRRLQANANVPANEAGNRSENENDEEEENGEKPEIPDHKIGAKKRAKLEAKAEKKAMREAIEREREERKKREQLLQAERDKQSEKERAEELKQEEAERKIREEKERKEHEEYLKMKEAFNIEEEGYEEENAENSENLLEEFVRYIKENKVVILEDLAAQFGLKTATVIQRIQDLQADGNLTGVIDDRGKFIYISQDELNAIVKFVQQRGRVSITELAENSNRLINLNPGSIEAR